MTKKMHKFSKAKKNFFKKYTFFFTKNYIYLINFLNKNVCN